MPACDANAFALIAATRFGAPERPGIQFDIDNDEAYRRWRDAKLDAFPASADELVVEVDDPRRLRASEREAIADRLMRANIAIYAGRAFDEDKTIARMLGSQFGLERLDSNWLADEDGISSLAVCDAGTRRDFIPYTDRPIRWHTDGYYNPSNLRIWSLILHCVRHAFEGGANSLLDHEIAYIKLRDANPDHIRALMARDAMTIPAREDEQGVARAAEAGPVFHVDSASGRLHMRYTARTRSIEWKGDDATRAAVTALEALLASNAPEIWRARLEAGMGLICANVLHDRSGFTDDPRRPRLLYRARYYDQIVV